MFINVNSFNFSSKFGLVLILLLIISALFSPILCQSKKVAIVSNIILDGKFNRNSFEQLTTLLNSNKDINVVLILGNVSKSGSVEELNNIQSELEKLKTSYYVIGGYNDYSGLSKYSSNFNQVFGDEDFILNDNGVTLVGINSIYPNFPNHAFVKAESIKKLLEESGLVKSDQVYFFSNNSFNRIHNDKSLLSVLKDKYIFSFYPTEKTFSAQLNSTNNVLEFGIPPCINSDKLNYFLLEQNADTIRITKQSNKSESLEVQYSISLKDLNKSNVSIDNSTVDSTITRTFELEFNSSSFSNNIISSNKIYTFLNNGLIYCNDLKGKEIFATELIGRVETNPVVYKDLLLTGNLEGDLYSINSNNGEILQVVGIGENITSDLSIIEILTANSKTIGVVFGTSEGNIFCYDAFTFELLWKKSISKTPIIATPLVEKDKVVFLNSNSSLYCVNSKSGSLNWKYEFFDRQNFALSSYPLSDGKEVFSISADGNLFAIDMLLGKKTWSSNTKGCLNQFYLTSDKQKLFLADGKGVMTIYSANNGKEISKIDFKKSELFSFIITENQEETFVGFSDGSLYTIDPKFVTRELLSPTHIPISSINVISKDEFIVKDINGKISFYRIN
jgi:outer membrane protein assembly factor BamB/predicted phosphodiesterase